MYSRVRWASAIACATLAYGAPCPTLATAATPVKRILFWVNCAQMPTITDEQLDRWRGLGVGGFVCDTHRLEGMGGSNRFKPTDEPDELAGEGYELQRGLVENDVAARLKKRGMRIYLSAYMVNAHNETTPLSEWFDDAGWRVTVLPAMAKLAGAADAMGFAGIAFDQELYGKPEASWDVNYDGHRHDFATIRAQVARRGAQTMRTLVRAFPSVRILVYDARFPESWAEVAQEVQGRPNAQDDRVDTNFWDGMTGVRGYSSVNFLEASFYKETWAGTWDSALRYHYNSTYAYFSRNWRSWSYASGRVRLAPFSWIDHERCNCGFERARSPEHVFEQLSAFQRWGPEEVANFSYSGLSGFDYSPYERALEAAVGPSETRRPSLRVTGSRRVTRDGRRFYRLRGLVHDNRAVRRVYWSAARRTGAAALEWRISRGDYASDFSWRTTWSVEMPINRATKRKAYLVAEDIKGNRRRVRVRL